MAQALGFRVGSADDGGHVDDACTADRLARLNDALKPLELTFARYEALMLLFFSRTGSLPMGKMGTRLQVHPTSVTNLIDGLEKLGYVSRAPHPERPPDDAGHDHRPGPRHRPGRHRGAQRDALRHR